jgi:hypothetical protein
MSVMVDPFLLAVDNATQRREFRNEAQAVLSKARLSSPRRL